MHIHWCTTAGTPQTSYQTQGITGVEMALHFQSMNMTSPGSAQCTEALVTWLHWRTSPPDEVKWPMTQCDIIQINWKCGNRVVATSTVIEGMGTSVLVTIQDFLSFPVLALIQELKVNQPNRTQMAKNYKTQQRYNPPLQYQKWKNVLLAALLLNSKHSRLLNFWENVLKDYHINQKCCYWIIESI